MFSLQFQHVFTPHFSVAQHILQRVVEEVELDVASRIEDESQVEHCNQLEPISSWVTDLIGQRRDGYGVVGVIHLNLQ